ncbi:DNA polymerase III subunit gamma and tau [Saccharopolyspora sp. NFXS83]|uniref:DNA polymerase III subunit gamma and tau n=1 Tax=Saccharopolyspora sp. NFXS83 TaxID=2993560 RepID=UPI00224AE296|nr:DNA polymerase III subunit gamma and tau [Saccharopolyspora sp. NFXS83]MCX2732552.1 DNA polymerase III subunit gamma and tau [Saccharopolyspora sp. NFXS83]
MALALYRKYRPATFAEVVGQEHVTEPLRTALSAQRINHAYLFSGPRGCGKTSSARILARSLNCAQGPTPDPCGECDSCVALAPEGSGSVDVVELDAASHGGVDDTRELRDRAFFAPAQSRYRIFIIDEAHMVTTQGFNALLKIVEEPPEHLIFVFATTEPDKVLTTIRSRTHHYPFRLMPPGVMRDLLERICGDEGVQVEPAVYPLVIRAGGGSARDTLSVLDQLLAGAGDDGVTYERAVALLGVTDVALIDDMVDALAAGDGGSVYGTVDKLVEAGHDPRRFAADLLDRLRDLVLLHAVPDAGTRGLIDTAGDELTKMQTQTEQLGAATLSRYAEIVHTGLQDMRGATAPRLLLELLCARMMLPAVSESESALLQRIEQVERRMTLAPPASAPAEAGAAPAAGAPAGAAPVAEAAPAGGRRVFQRPSDRQAPGGSDGADRQAPTAAPKAASEPATEQPAAEQRSVNEQRVPENEQPVAQQQPAATAEQPAAQVPAERPGPSAPAASQEPARPAPAPAPPQAEPTGPAVAEPGAAHSAGFGAADVRRVWTDLLRAVAQRNRPTQALLLNATVHDYVDGALVLTMPTSGLVKQFAQQRRIDFVREAMSDVLGAGPDYEVRCVEAGSAPAPQRPAGAAGAGSAGNGAKKDPPQPAAPPTYSRPSAARQAQAQQPAPDSGNGGQRKPAPERPARPSGANGRARSSSDDIPPPPEPPPDDEPPPEDALPPAPPPDDEDEEAMIAGSSPASEADAAPRRDREEEAVELFAAELGARKIED